MISTLIQYLDFNFDLDISLDFNSDLDFDFDLGLDFNFDLDFDFDLVLDFNFYLDFDFGILTLTFTFYLKPPYPYMGQSL